MANKWKSLVESQNAKTYVLPVGWESRTRVAEDLECSEERVRILLAPAIKNGTVETDSFVVWDAATKRLNRVTAYRKVVKTIPLKKV